VLTDCLGTLYGCGMLVLPFTVNGEIIGLSDDLRARMLLALIPLPVALGLAVWVLRRSDTPFFLVATGKADEAYRLMHRMAA